MIFSFGGLGLRLVAFRLGLALGLVILSFGRLRLGLVAIGLALGLRLVKVAIVSTLLIPACYASCTVYCVSRGGVNKVYIKFDMGERRKRLKIWPIRTRDKSGVEGTRLEAKDTKNIRGQRQPFRGQTLSKARTQAQVFSKKIMIIKSSKIFFTRVKKKVFKIFFQEISKKQNQKISKKTNFATKNELQNFKNSKNTAVLEPRTGQFSRT